MHTRSLSTISGKKSLSKKETDQIFAKTKSRIKNSGLEILLAPTHLDFGRIIVITPKAIGNAPKRNQIRRRLKAVFYEEKLFSLLYDCAVIVRKPALNLEHEELKNIFVSLVKKLPMSRPVSVSKQ